MKDLDLIRRAREGDAASGPVLVSIYGSRLSGYLHSIAPDLRQVERELLAEDTIEAALANLDRFDEGRASFDSWLRGFARMKLLEFRRTRPASTVDASELVQEEPPVAPEEWQTHPLTVLLTQALTKLAPADQLIIALRDINSLPYREIAQRLDCSEAAARVRHHRAIRNIRELMEDLEKDKGS